MGQSEHQSSAKSRPRSIWTAWILLPVAFGFSLASVPALSQQYEYKLFQYSTSTMNAKVEQFAQTNPGWEPISITTMGLKDLGGGAGSIPLSVLLLARKEIPGTHLPPSAVSTVPSTNSTPVPTSAVATFSPVFRVTPTAAPVWALGSSFPGDMAKAINDKLVVDAPANASSHPAVVDVVIDDTGSVLLVTPRPDAQTVGQLTMDTIAAVKAASPFQPIPSTATVVSLLDRTFTFSVAP